MMKATLASENVNGLFFLISVVISIVLMSLGAAGAVATQPAPGAPNIVLVLIDDAALMDLGSYGGRAETATIDQLASTGTLFTQYRTSPMCAPSRAMLLTGADSHLTGMATIPEMLPEEQVGKPGYSMHLEPRVITIASRLKALGYKTYMTGKWHLGSGAEDLPDSHGFDRSFVLDASGADNWEQKSYMPYYETAPWFEDGVVANLPEDFYSSKFIVDQMLSYLGSEQHEQTPFFAYLAFQAIHIPVQAPAEFIRKYHKAFDDGWDVLRQSRWREAKLRGLIHEDAVLAPMPSGLRPWDSLTEAQQRHEATRMEVNAGMLDAMDFHLGRLIAYLQQTEAFANTLFIITSDNGPEPSSIAPGFVSDWMLQTSGYHNNLEGMGGKGSFGFIGPEWASAAASPSALFKFYSSEGGVRAPLIFSGPGIPRGQKVDAFSLVTDIAPTIFELAGGEMDLSEPHLVTGRSLTPVLSGVLQARYDKDEPVGLEAAGNSALYRGDYKIARNYGPYGDGAWRLFNINLDPGETTDLKFRQPEVFDQLLNAYQEYVLRNGVRPMPAGFTQGGQLRSNTLQVILMRNRNFLLVCALGFMLCLVVGLLLYQSRRVRPTDGS
jgi:arylsulfatase/uncharacterized sulfatase